MPRLPFWLPFLACAIFAEVSADDVKLGTYMAYARPSVLLENGNGTSLELEPRGTTRSGIEVRYRGYGVSFSAPLADLSTLSDFRAFYHGTSWGLEGYHRASRGFSAQTPGVGDGTAERPDMTLRSTRVTGYRSVGDSRIYRLSEGLSTPGMEPDIFMVFGLSRDRLRDTAPFLRETGVSGSSFDGVHDLGVYSLSMGGGFALSTNLSGVYFDPALFGGLGAQFSEVRGWEERSGMSWGLVTVGLRMRFGYRNRFMDAGVGFENDAHVLAGESAIFNALIARAQLQVYL